MIRTMKNEDVIVRINARAGDVPEDKTVRELWPAVDHAIGTSGALGCTARRFGSPAGVREQNTEQEKNSEAAKRTKAGRDDFVKGQVGREKKLD